MDLHAKIVVGFKEVDNLLPQMVNVDHDLVESGRFEFQDHMLQHRFPSDGNQCLGQIVCQRLEPAT